MTRILVIDDDATNRKLVAKVLGFEGYEILEAADGSDGLVSARTHRPHLVISDILMPSMDGYEFVRRLRLEPGLEHTPVIFYTATYHDREARVLAEKCHVQRVITKPCEPGEFVRSIRAVLEGNCTLTAPVVDDDFDTAHLRLLTDKLSETAAELKVTNQRLAALLELNIQLASERDPPTLLRKVCSNARNLIGARFAVLAVTARSSAEPIFFATSGIEGADALTPPGLDVGVFGRVMQERRCLRLANRAGSLLDLDLPASYPRARAVLIAPITSPGRTFGWLCLADKIGAEEFGAEDDDVLGILCAQVGRIYENGSLYAEVQNYAAELLVEMQERELAVNQLLASEERFRQLAENIDDALYVMTPDLAEVLYASPAYEQIWQRSRQELIADPSAWMRCVHPDDRDRITAEVGAITRALPGRSGMEFRIVRPDQSVRWIQTRIFAVRNAQGTVVRAIGVSTDVTDHRVAEHRVRQLNRVHSMLSSINSLIVRADDRREMLREACRLAIDQGQFGIAWCGLLNPDTGEVRAAAWAGDFSTLEVDPRPNRSDPSQSDHPIVAAIESRQPVICNELRAEPAQGNYLAALQECGYRAMVALPLVAAGQSVGCLVLATREGSFFDADEMCLLSDFAGDIAFALDHIEKAERLNYLAYYDLATGLANRTLFQERLAQHVDIAHQGNTFFAVLIANPDRLEALSGSLGRAAADQLMHAVAGQFARCIGSAERVGRVGADKLAAIITGLREASDLPGVVEDLWRAWLTLPFEVSGREIAVSAIAGIAVFPADGADAETLIRNAEAALSNAHSSGKRFTAFTPQLSERLAERLVLEKNMLRALEHNEFILHYQPKVDLSSRRLEGLEALIRWRSPELGLVAPGKFVPLIEENGLIVEVGAWVLRQAMRDRARWLGLGLDPPRVAVNVSTVQLRRDDFVRTISDIVGQAGGECGIDIEVTESLLMEDVTENLAKLAAVHELGIDIALDDFGTGYSSLGYLAKLPVQTLKIDRSFVAGMLDDPGATALVSTIISLAGALKLDTVAEGVETEDQAKVLRLLRCRQMQGYLVSRPLSFEDMTAYLRRCADSSEVQNANVALQRS